MDTGDAARLGADVDRYSFIVVDLHRLFLAGFDRRTPESTHSGGSGGGQPVPPWAQEQVTA
jgi:hypothetical protein